MLILFLIKCYEAQELDFGMYYDKFLAYQVKAIDIVK
ncbi:hypothetical protein BofuT4_uP017580.1 [Botrytis cinerea T4]|uniref:Uncharacterized protein n=1 Tax=Botryotinia fuckeliana (strain T4) TaxID=999810 RepID=G2YIB5_BOTF4|nr:hypothetical protein BofuT4_uP017580.1 [Botrytis cinerea T4]